MRHVDRSCYSVSQMWSQTFQLNPNKIESMEPQLLYFLNYEDVWFVFDSGTLLQYLYSAALQWPNFAPVSSSPISFLFPPWLAIITFCQFWRVVRHWRLFAANIYVIFLLAIGDGINVWGIRYSPEDAKYCLLQQDLL